MSHPLYEHRFVIDAYTPDTLPMVRLAEYMADVAHLLGEVERLINTLEQRRETINIPTPALSEVLVHAHTAGPEYLNILDRHACFRIAPLDQRAAVELAAGSATGTRPRAQR